MESSELIAFIVIIAVSMEFILGYIAGGLHQKWRSNDYKNQHL